MLRIPESPRSISSFNFSESSGSPPKLDPNTLALLDMYFADKAEEERRFKALAEERAAAQIAGLALDDGQNEKPMVSVEEFKLAFGEDWQLSQFWYSKAFAHRLAKYLHSQCTPSSTIAFVCCPTAFVAFQHMKPLPGARLLEFDQRFAVLAPTQYIPYDLDEPDSFPESLKGSVDFIITDPPFLNEVTNQNLVRTFRQILQPEGKLLIITSTSVEDILHRLCGEPPLGPLRKASLEIEHRGLANDFAAWGSWDGAENFGKEDAQDGLGA